jgi:imidazolonepropionase
VRAAGRRRPAGHQRAKALNADLVIEGAGEVFTGEATLRGAVVAIAGGAITYVGPPVEFGPETRRYDARGGLVTPGLVDPHTHLVFGGDRSGEYAERARGRSYLDIARAGGGIAATVRATRAASVDELAALARPRLDRLLAHGVTTAEVKSGYGLDPATELKILEVVRALDAAHPIDLVPTFLGAHTVPAEHKAGRGRYLDQVVEEMIPAVAERGLAAFCDVFVEETAFSLAEAERVLVAGLTAGLRPKVHADQLTAGGGAELAAGLGAVSADHLEHVSEAGVRALADAGTVAVLLPGAALFLGQTERAPARTLIEAGVPVALATDCNPGTCMTENLLLMLTLGMSWLRLSPEEVLAAVTVHAARAVGRADRAGLLAPGRPADVALFDVPSVAHLPYHFGVPHARAVFKAGRLVLETNL